jgi:antitoxin (DNA-binding transcriptional repressor) of toxin-antitoxin stability system
MKVSTQEFKANLAKYVSQAQSGELIELTSHRRVVAHLTGVPATADPAVSRLLAVGAASWNGGKPKGADLRVQSGGKSLSAMVIEDRG